MVTTGRTTHLVVLSSLYWLQTFFINHQKKIPQQHSCWQVRYCESAEHHSPILMFVYSQMRHISTHRALGLVYNFHFFRVLNLTRQDKNKLILRKYFKILEWKASSEHLMRRLCYDLLSASWIKIFLLLITSRTLFQPTSWVECKQSERIDDN